MSGPPVDGIEVLDRVEGRAGELVLRRRASATGTVLEVVSGGVFLMDTSDGRSERMLVREAVRVGGGGRVLIGGLGVGFSLLEALSLPAVERVVVVELEPTIVRWHERGPLAGVTQGAIGDSRVEVVVDDVLAVLRGSLAAYDAVCLDTDNGPDWLVRPENARLYAAAGIDLAARALRPGGAASFWSASASPAFEAALRSRFGSVARHEVAVARGEPDVVWVGTAPRPVPRSRPH